MNTHEFYYDLPKELIAQYPVEPRDQARMMTIDKQTGRISHKHFYDIEQLLNSGDVLVLNNTKVIPARLYCHKENCTGKIEILLLKRINLSSFEALGKPLKRVSIGQKLIFSDNLSAIVNAKTDVGGIEISFEIKRGTLEEEFDKIGEMPLPHYITKKLENKNDYQTVYARIDGSSACPTAGLHFTNELLEKLKAKGVEIENVVLDVGLGTFRPVTSDRIEEHHMHSERCYVSETTAERLNKAKKEGRRIIAVGTTSVRTLETAYNGKELVAGEYNTDIFIYPTSPKQIMFVDAIITNFHLPESTLIMLVSSFLGTKLTLNAYKVAVEQKYRFFSFGDCMFIQ